MSDSFLPGDRHDDALRRLVAPANWPNPVPAPQYNLVVLGGGPAGLVCAAGAAGLGAKVALIERGSLGGDCLNVGCVPSKTLLRSARLVAELRRASHFGIHAPEPTVDFAAVMERVRSVRAGLATHDSAERFRALGIDVFLGEGRFRDDESIEVNGAVLNFRKAVITTGTRAATIPSPLSTAVPVYTNESIFTLTTLPKRLLVIGAGPVGCELGQAFARLGSVVTLIAKGGRVLPREDADAAELLANALKADGVSILPEVPAGFAADAVLMAVGRVPNVDSLNLAAAGIAFDETAGVAVDERLRTTNRRVFAAGDVAAKMPHFTHAADAMARVVLRNALFVGRAKFDPQSIPRCTYTEPEVASIGDTDSGNRVLRVELADLDRGATDGASGFVKLFLAAKSDRILGATVVGSQAGEIIGTLSLALAHRMGARAFADTVFPYPTYTESLRKLGDQFNRARLTPWVARLLRGWLRWTRKN